MQEKKKKQTEVFTIIIAFKSYVERDGVIVTNQIENK